MGTKPTRSPGHKVVRTLCEHVISRAGIEKFAPHDLARTFVRFCHDAGGELDQMNCPAGISYRVKTQEVWMKALIYREIGEPKSVLKLEEIPPPPLAPGG